MKKTLLLFFAFWNFKSANCQTGSSFADSLFQQYNTIVYKSENVIELTQITIREGKGNNSVLNHIYFLIVKKDSVFLDSFYLSNNRVSKQNSKVLDFSESQYIRKVMSDFKCFDTAGKCWHEKGIVRFHTMKGGALDMKYVNFSKNEWFIKSIDKSREYIAPENPYKIGFKTHLFDLKCKSLYNNLKSRIRFRKIERILRKV